MTYNTIDAYYAMLFNIKCIFQTAFFQTKWKFLTGFPSSGENKSHIEFISAYSSNDNY